MASEWSLPPASAAAASRGLPESRAGGESGRGLVLTVIVAFPCLEGRCSGSLLPRERGFHGDYTLPARAAHAPWARARRVGPAHTRVSGQLLRREARREGGAGEA